MADLPTTSPPPSARELRRTNALIGALLGTLVWLELIAFGVPTILFGTVGYGAIPVATLGGALLGLARTRRLLLAIALAFALVLLFVSFTPIIRRPTHALIRSDPIGARPVQAVVVLSGGITNDAYLKPPVVDRMLTGLSLVRRGVTNTLILTRERRRVGGHPITSDADQQRLLALLERPVRLLIVDSIYSTRDEAVRTRALARALDLNGIAVVTSPTHTYRACATFEKVGFTVTCVPSDSRKVALRAMSGVTNRVLALQACLYEWAGLAKYRVKGWI